MLLRYEGNDVPHVSRGSNRKCCEVPAIPYREKHPAVKKRDQVAVSFAKVNVLPAGVGKHGAEFGEGDTGAQRNHSTERPHQKKQRRVRQRPGNIFGGKKNGRANDATHQQQYGVEQTEPTDETRLLTGCFSFGGRGSGRDIHYVVGRLFKRRSSRWSLVVGRLQFAIHCRWVLPTT